jgi:acetate kinase
MGFTPLDGLVMATRSGSIDPGLVLWLEEHVHMPSAELAATLEHRSGLLGLAGTADMRAILAAEAEGDEGAILAVGVYLHRLRAAVAAMVAALGGLDVLVFTGGVGENAPAIRQRLCADLTHLGVMVDSEANDAVEGDTEISGPRTAARTLVIVAREDLEVVRQVRQVLVRVGPPAWPATQDS